MGTRQKNGKTACKKKKGALKRRIETGRKAISRKKTREVCKNLKEFLQTGGEGRESKKASVERKAERRSQCQMMLKKMTLSSHDGHATTNKTFAYK